MTTIRTNNISIYKHFDGGGKFPSPIYLHLLTYPDNKVVII
nr:MAG TPA: hypothetical protein [Caudoviricetes sp.]